MPEAFSEPSQTSKMEPLTIFIKSPAEVFEWILNTPLMPSIIKYQSFVLLFLEREKY